MEISEAGDGRLRFSTDAVAEQDRFPMFPLQPRLPSTLRRDADRHAQVFGGIIVKMSNPFPRDGRRASAATGSVIPARTGSRKEYRAQYTALFGGSGGWRAQRAPGLSRRVSSDRAFAIRASETSLVLQQRRQETS